MPVLITIEILELGIDIESEIKIGVLQKAIEMGMVRIVDGHHRFAAFVAYGNPDLTIKIMKVENDEDELPSDNKK